MDKQLTTDRQKIFEIVRNKHCKAKITGMVLIFLLVVTALASVNLGKADISITDVVSIVAGKIVGNAEYYSHIGDARVAIVWDVRLPRILAAIVVGCGLAVSGAVFQAILMNPLADSYTMGVSTGAAFGASIAIYLNIFSVVGSNLPVTIFAFGGAMLALGIVLSISRVGGYVTPANLVIAGIIVSCVLSAAISLIKSISGEQVAAIVSWLIGSLSARNWGHVIFSFPVVIVCSALCCYYAEDLNIVSLGDREARALGVDSSKLRNIFLVCGAFITAVCVSISGIIGFVGLIVPHMLRMIVGSDNKILIPLCGLMGGLLLLFADTFARSFMNVEVPVGVLTTLLGGPFFFYIFRIRNKNIQ
ncbi:FecCD family ABC transporter permease [Desulfoscipio gibsoniae]|uniref:ABC-type Fe3+-siderophore transport system, permease component n=1 Tax=Desulfoscipio gibsoniae DSM 7213 TaxID=767817 RepID=R4KKT2_9FIRM|nr:iron ABC transporter permease [Desulfoscipio gibsoniae]AGL00246.1 ABC-type Fe3+-siderophore transport system, permease component [Desulfoscipio gibsoniae DSM 7213]